MTLRDRGWCVRGVHTRHSVRRQAARTEALVRYALGRRIADDGIDAAVKRYHRLKRLRPSNFAFEDTDLLETRI